MARNDSPRRNSRPARRRTGLPVIIALAVLVIIGSSVAGAGWYALYRPQHDVAPGSTTEIVIAKGASTARIAETLASSGIVDNQLMFRLRARDADIDGQLKAGTYEMRTGMGYEAALEQLKKGPDVVYVEVVIPEGFTGKKIAARFASQTSIDETELLGLIEQGAPRFAANHPYLKGAFRDTLEGFLFPATYRVKEGATAEDVVEMMLDAFEANTADLDLSYAESKNLTLTDVVTIASMIEHEAKIEKEFPLVASVVYNRLKAKMKLQLCATVLYTLPKSRETLTNEDLKTDSPYNTYLHNGLPPGPVGSPGLKTLRAAASPSRTEYLYYVLTGKNGSHTFTTNYADFLKAKQVYKTEILGQ